MASSPKRVLRTMKRGEDGAAVKISAPLQGAKKFWEPPEDSFLPRKVTPRGERKEQKNNTIYNKQRPYGCKKAVRFFATIQKDIIDFFAMNDIIKLNK